MNLPDATSRIETACRAAGLSVPSPDDTEKLLLVGLQILANREQYTRRLAQFRKAYTGITLTSGIADLSTKTDLLIDHIDGQSIVHSDETRVDLLPPSTPESYLTTPKAIAMTYFARRKNNTLQVYDGFGDPAPDGTLSLDSGFASDLASLPPQFDDNLIMIVVGLITGTEGKDEQTAA